VLKIIAQDETGRRSSEANLPRHGARGERMVTGHHDRVNSGPLAGCHCLRDPFANRILKRQQPGELIPALRLRSGAGGRIKTA
jgi:hypothetical protein